MLVDAARRFSFPLLYAVCCARVPLCDLAAGISRIFPTGDAIYILCAGEGTTVLAISIQCFSGGRKTPSNVCTYSIFMYVDRHSLAVVLTHKPHLI